MASGVQVDDDCKTAFTEIKLGHKHRYVVYAIDKPMKKIEVQCRAGRDKTYADLVNEFKEAEKDGECRYAVFDAEYEKNGQKVDKILFMMWNPEDSKIKQKMVYASSKDALKRALGEGLGLEIQACDHGDLSWETIMEKNQ